MSEGFGKSLLIMPTPTPPQPRQRPSPPSKPATIFTTTVIDTGTQNITTISTSVTTTMTITILDSPINTSITSTNTISTQLSSPPPSTSPPTAPRTSSPGNQSQHLDTYRRVVCKLFSVGEKNVSCKVFISAVCRSVRVMVCRDVQLVGFRLFS